MQACDTDIVNHQDQQERPKKRHADRPGALVSKSGRICKCGVYQVLFSVQCILRQADLNEIVWHGLWETLAFGLANAENVRIQGIRNCWSWSGSQPISRLKNLR